MIADFIMGLIQLVSAGFMGISVWQLYKAKLVRGISAITVSFWVAWGFWDLYYFPSLGQWWAFAGAVAVTLINMLYVYLIVTYNRRERAAIRW